MITLLTMKEYEESESTGRFKGPPASLTALIPAKLRSRLLNLSQRALSTSISLAKMAGKAAWIVTTSVLLIGLPLFTHDREKSLVEYEKEQQRFAPPVASQ